MTETAGARTDRYHHGDLPNALRRAACDVIDERGLGNFSLREVARRAGVSHTAPAHHFGDMQGLLTSVATEGFAQLAAAMEQALVGLTDPFERMVALGTAYVEFARTHSAHLDVMFRVDITDDDDEQLALVGMRAYGVLESTVRDLIETEDLDLDLDVACTMCWANVQGLVALSPKLDHVCEAHGRDLPDDRELVRLFVDFTVNGMRAHKRR
jgi:AcrR family transcriptional regulator